MADGANKINNIKCIVVHCGHTCSTTCLSHPNKWTRDCHVTTLATNLACECCVPLISFPKSVLHHSQSQWIPFSHLRLEITISKLSETLYPSLAHNPENHLPKKSNPEQIPKPRKSNTEKIKPENQITKPKKWNPKNNKIKSRKQ